MSMFELKFPSSAVPRLVREYSRYYSDERPLGLAPRIRSRGYLTLGELREIAHWKSPRPSKRVASNAAIFVKEVTGAALASSEPRFKIEVLRLLSGVEWPTASVILHFCDQQRWPVLDYRAFWSLSAPDPALRCDFGLWEAYTESTRGLADRFGIGMRDLDRALWTYSKLNQPVGRG